MKKEKQNRSKIIQRIILSITSKRSKKRDKKIPQEFGFDLRILALGGINLSSVPKSMERRENFTMPQKSYEKVCKKLRPDIPRNKGF